MKEKIEQISKEIWELKPKSKIDFNEYFKKYEVAEQSKFECYDAIMENLIGWISVEKKYKNAIVGLPFNIPHIKNKKRVIQSYLNKTGIEEIIAILENGKPYREITAKENKDGTRTIGCIEYDERVQKLFRQISEYSKDYNKNIEKVMSKESSKLSSNETIQYLTYIYRKERVCEGHIAMHIDNGVLLNLLKHLLEINE